MQVEPYLQFDGRCEEALDFYKKAIGAQVDFLMRFGDSPEPCPPEEMPTSVADKVMHSSFRVGGTRVMASDGYCKGAPKFDGFSLALQAKDKAEAQSLFDALRDGGKVDMPLGATFVSPAFGVLTDRFGVSWMIVVEQKAAAASAA